jgi:hypothetical protein
MPLAVPSIGENSVNIIDLKPIFPNMSTYHCAEKKAKKLRKKANIIAVFFKYFLII